MYSTVNKKKQRGAEDAFREAFSRLKENCPTRLRQGTRVSQNNVAREAGCDPSALKKSRYPELVADIKKWLLANPPSNRTSRKNVVDRDKRLKERIAEITAQRDQVASLLVQADLRILELSRRVAMLEALRNENVVRLS